MHTLIVKLGGAGIIYESGLPERFKWHSYRSLRINAELLDAGAKAIANVASSCRIVFIMGGTGAFLFTDLSRALNFNINDQQKVGCQVVDLLAELMLKLISRYSNDVFQSLVCIEDVPQVLKTNKIVVVRSSPEVSSTDTIAAKLYVMLENPVLMMFKQTIPIYYFLGSNPVHRSYLSCQELLDAASVAENTPGRRFFIDKDALQLFSKHQIPVILYNTKDLFRLDQLAIAKNGAPCTLITYKTEKKSEKVFQSQIPPVSMGTSLIKEKLNFKSTKLTGKRNIENTITDAQKERDNVFFMLLGKLVNRNWHTDKFGVTSNESNKKLDESKGHYYPGHNIGAIAVDSIGRLHGWAMNTNHRGETLIEHAESNLLHQLFEKSEPERGYGERLGEFTVYTSLEPCFACAGMLVVARVKRVVFLQSDPESHNILQTMVQLRKSSPYKAPIISSGESIGSKFAEALEESYLEFVKRSDGSEVDHFSNNRNLTTFLTSNSAKQIFDVMEKTLTNPDTLSLKFPNYKPSSDALSSLEVREYGLNLLGPKPNRCSGIG